jgi:glutamine cyclotransferase
LGKNQPIVASAPALQVAPRTILWRGLTLTYPPGATRRPLAASPAGRRWLVVARLALVAALIAALAGVRWPSSASAAVHEARPPLTDVPRAAYKVVASYPHDPAAFLQGLVWHDGGFYESTGLYGRSSLRRVAFPSGAVVQQRPLADEHFGEGLARVGERLVQLTWRAGLGFVYDRMSLELLETFSYPTEGWGLTFDGESLIMSDGSHVLTFLDPHTYQPLRTLSVTASGQPVPYLNELEWIEGEIWANVWLADLIVRIDPATGQVTSVLDLAGLYPSDQRSSPDAVLNGIAYDPQQRRTFVGGKLWPLLFEIRVLDGSCKPPDVEQGAGVRELLHPPLS